MSVSAPFSGLERKSCLAPAPVAADHNDVCAFVRQAQGGCLTYARTATGNETDSPAHAALWSFQRSLPNFFLLAAVLSL